MNYKNKTFEELLNYIEEMQEFSNYPLSNFTGITKEEAIAYIEANEKLSYKSIYTINNGY